MACPSCNSKLVTRSSGVYYCARCGGYFSLPHTQNQVAIAGIMKSYRSQRGHITPKEES